jgi:hypothetical protein
MTNRPDPRDFNHYAKVIMEQLNVFRDEFPTALDYEEKATFCCEIFNAAVYKKRFGKEAFEERYPSFENPELAVKLIAYKEQFYPDFDRDIANVYLENGNLVVDMDSQMNRFDQVLENMMGEPANKKNDAEEPLIMNRSAIVIGYKKPFLEWVNEIINEEPFTLAELEGNAYLIPEQEGFQQVGQWVTKHFDRIFKIELSEWSLDPKNWPKKRTYELFRAWFSVSKANMIFDLDDELLERE